MSEYFVVTQHQLVSWLAIRTKCGNTGTLLPDPTSSFLPRPADP